MKRNTTLLLFFFGCTFLVAQHSISGKITAENNESIPFANVILHQKKSTKNPKGTVSKDNGQFNFENISEGVYYIEISVLGFKIKKSNEFNLSANKTIDFVLKEENENLDEVEIIAKRPVIRQTAEKLIVDLEKSEMTNASLKDVVKRVPGIVVTNNGINFAGRSDVRILINGKTTQYMDTDTLLRDLPADNIAKVELIEQPGAEFDAEGSGPIINIILKKNVRLGTHGSAGAWIGEDEGAEFGASVSIASYKNKLNWQANAGQSSPTWRDDLFIDRAVVDTLYSQATKEPFCPKRFWLGGSIDYYINEKNTIGFGTRYNNSISTRIATGRTTITYPTRTEYLFSDNSFDRNRETFSFNPYYEFKNDAHKFIFDFNYVQYKNDNVDNVYGVAGNTIPFTNQRYLQNGEFNIKTFKADYIKTFSDNLKVSFGSKHTRVKTDSNLLSYAQNSTSGDFDFVESNSNRFLIDEAIFALYSKINATVGKWSFSGGLRYEKSNTEGTATNTNETRNRSISKLFPSASVSRKINDNLGANMAYSYRIRRPSYSSLNSFVQYYDPLTSEVGNPNLKPSFTSNYQFNLTFDKQPFFTVAYSKTKDDLFLFISQDDATAQISRSTINILNRENWNFRLFGPLDFIKGVEGFTGFIVDYNTFESTDLAPALQLKKWNYGWYTQASYELPWKINFEASSYFGSGALEGQIDVGWIGNLDFSFGKKFLDDRLKVNLGFNKMLNRGFVGTVNYDNINANIEANGSRQNIQLRLNYSFGSKFGKKKSKRNASKDVENRINDNN